jgi:hypothetical protein
MRFRRIAVEPENAIVRLRSLGIGIKDRRIPRLDCDLVLRHNVLLKRSARGLTDKLEGLA